MILNFYNPFNKLPYIIGYQNHLSVTSNYTISIINLVNKSSMISNPVSKRLSNFIKFSAYFSTSNLAHIVGAKPEKLIDTSTAEWFNQITEKYPQNIFIHSYSQNVSLSY